MSKVHKLGMEHKKFCYDKKTEPALKIRSGDTVIFETEDANCGLITRDTDLWARFEDIYEAAGGCNPVTGPVYVEGAKEGDCLLVEIINVTPGLDRQGGYTSIQSGVGVLEDINGTFQEPLEPKTRICGFEDGMVVMGTEEPGVCLKVPMNPFVGSVGVAPKYDRRASFYQGSEWCGNIDICDVRPGASVVLPVNVEGGLLLMGDVHACQGDGEITGCALECQGTIEARITLLSREEAGFVNCPQVNGEEFIGSVGLPGCADLTAAMKAGYTDLVRRMERDYGIAQCDGYMLLNLAGEVRVGNEMSCLCKIRRDVLKKYRGQEG